jgi:Phosphodiester glycosidase
MAMTTQLEPPLEPLRNRSRKRRWALGVSVAVLVGIAGWPVASYVSALTYPGEASFTVRTVEWVRDHGGGGLVDVVENWWYSQPPSAAAPNVASLPSPAAPSPSTPREPSPIPVAPGLKPFAGEGRWAAGRAGSGGAPAIFTTFERPDPLHPSIVAGVARIDTHATRLQLVAGTTQPDHTSGPERAQVPVGARAGLVATFNSGFKMIDANGGFYAGGRTAKALRPGAASVVIRADGTATVGQWGRDATLTPDVVAVRQNLDLVVDDGRPVADLADNSGGRWGSTHNQVQYTWRSGLGVDASGDLIYVGGGGLNLTTLAAALVQVGAVRAMQLDIHTEMVDFLTYPVGADHAAYGVKLLPDMAGGANRYLVPDQRDFFAVILR